MSVGHRQVAEQMQPQFAKLKGYYVGMTADMWQNWRARLVGTGFNWAGIPENYSPTSFLINTLLPPDKTTERWTTWRRSISSRRVPGFERRSNENRSQFVQGALATSCGLGPRAHALTPPSTSATCTRIYSSSAWEDRRRRARSDRSRGGQRDLVAGRWSAMCRGCASPPKASSRRAAQAGRSRRVVRERPRPHQAAHRRSESQSASPQTTSTRRSPASRTSFSPSKAPPSSRTMPSRWSALTSSACAACSSCTTSRTRWAIFRPRRRSMTGRPTRPKVVQECNRLGILVDLAHCTDASVRQALEVRSSR